MKPYFESAGISIYHGDFMAICEELPMASALVCDPPYNQTSLVWDRWPQGWVECASRLAPSIWVFGTLRMFMDRAGEFAVAELAMSQDIVWEKHNGSSFHADRFRRVHEQAVHFYRGAWGQIYKHPPTTPDATARRVRQKTRPSHMGHIGESRFESHDGGPRLMRSVIYEPSCHGFAENETQKPLGIVRPLIEYSCPAGGLVIDPFMGSGTTLVAAKEMGRRAIGVDFRESQCEIAARRLQQEVMTFGEVVAL